MSVFNPLTSEYPTQLFAAIGKKLYLNSELADVHFSFESNGECERVPAHKAHLMSGSEVFATMFNGSWKENKEVKIVNASVAAFKEFLQFFYFDQVKLTMENVAAVMNLGEMYNVTECLAACSKFLKNNLNDDNVCRYYGLAVLFNQPSLKSACETFIGINITTVFKSTDFLSCDQKTLAQILKLDWMSCTEIELFEACMAWVKAGGRQDVLSRELVEAQLGELLHEIRFGTLTIQQFAALIPSYGHVFSFHEQQEIIQMIADPAFEPKMFTGNRNERRGSPKPWQANDEIICRRVISVHNSPHPYQIKEVETTVFSSNEMVLLRGFVCARVWKKINDQYQALEHDVVTHLTLIEVNAANNETILYNGIGSLNPIRNTCMMISKPVLIRPGFTYQIRLKQTPPISCCTGAMMKLKVQMDSGLTIQFHDNSGFRNDAKVARGLIYKLIFKAI